MARQVCTRAVALGFETLQPWLSSPNVWPRQINVLSVARWLRSGPLIPKVWAVSTCPYVRRLLDAACWSERRWAAWMYVQRGLQDQQAVLAEKPPGK